MSTTLSLADLVDLIQPDAQALADGRRRLTDLWQNRATDSLPILFAAPPPEGIAWNRDVRVHVENRDQMLYDQVAGLVGWSRAGSDAQISVRADTGTGTLCSAAGCQLLPSEYGLPWTTHVSKETLEAFDPHDIAEEGVMPRVCALYQYFRSRLHERSISTSPIRRVPSTWRTYCMATRFFTICTTIPSSCIA